MVAGVITAGADCAYTISGEPEEMTMDEFIDFLEPGYEPDGETEKGPAMCQSAKDWTSYKSALEELCRRTKRCRPEQKKSLENITRMLKAAENGVRFHEVFNSKK